MQFIAKASHWARKLTVSPNHSCFVLQIRDFQYFSTILRLFQSIANKKIILFLSRKKNNNYRPSRTSQEEFPRECQQLVSCRSKSDRARGNKKWIWDEIKYKKYIKIASEIKEVIQHLNFIEKTLFFLRWMGFLWENNSTERSSVQPELLFQCYISGSAQLPFSFVTLKASLPCPDGLSCQN